MLIPTQSQEIPGSESLMSSYDKIVGEAGFDLRKEQEENQRKIFNDFMKNARMGKVQGRGKFSQVFPPTATGFNDFLTADAAYQLHQGPGGAMHDKKIRNIDWSRI